MRLTRKDILTLANGLRAAGKLKGVKLAYAVAKNLNLLKTELAAIEEARKSAENERIELCRKLAEKDESGEPIIITSDKVEEYKIPNELKPKLTAELKILNDQFEVLLKGEVELEPHMIKLSDIPVDITGEIMEAIWPIIEEDNKK